MAPAADTVGSERQLRLGQRPLDLRQDRHHLGQQHAAGDRTRVAARPTFFGRTRRGCRRGRGRLPPSGGAVDEQAVAGHASSRGPICHASQRLRLSRHGRSFDNAAADALQAAAPLADRVRPTGLDGFVGHRT
jgi:hypothetical protein